MKRMTLNLVVIGLACLAVPVALAQQTFTQDVEIEKADPALLFNENLQSGYHWRLAGDATNFTLTSGAGGFVVPVLNAETADLSVALGFAAAASGESGTALGYYASAAGQHSIAIGTAASSPFGSSIVIGRLAVTDGANSVVIGTESESLSDDTVAIGSGSGTFSIGATAIGSGSSANGLNSTAVGIDSSTVAGGTVALGYAAVAMSPDSMAIGPLSYAWGTKSAAIGYRAFSNTPNTVILGPEPPLNGATEYANVGMGTSIPTASLHIVRDNGQAGVIVEERSTDVAPRTLFTLANPGNTKFEIMNTDAMESWAFTNSGTDFRVSLQDSGVIEFRVDNDGNAYVANNMELGGTLTEMSDRNQKHAIVPLDSEAVLTKVSEVPISEWSYKTESADQRHIGPMAQDFYAAFGLASGETRISARDMAGVNMAAIQALVERNADLELRLASLESTERENEALKERLVLLENWVAQQMPRSAQN